MPGCVSQQRDGGGAGAKQQPRPGRPVVKPVQGQVRRQAMLRVAHSDFPWVSSMQHPVPESWRSTRPRLLAVVLKLLARQVGAAKAAPDNPDISAHQRGRGLPLRLRVGGAEHGAGEVRRTPGGFDVQRSAVVMHGGEPRQLVAGAACARVDRQPLKTQACNGSLTRSVRSPRCGPSV